MSDSAHERDQVLRLRYVAQSHQETIAKVRDHNVSVLSAAHHLMQLIVAHPLGTADVTKDTPSQETDGCWIQFVGKVMSQDGSVMSDDY